MSAVDEPETETEIMRRGAAMLAERLPAGWSAFLDADGKPGTDASIEVKGTDGSSATLVAEAKRAVDGRDVGALGERLAARAKKGSEGQGLLMARYLSPPVREKLAEAGLSYVDATGNIRVEIDSPGLFISDRGADRDPWRGPGRPRGTLKGEPAAKVVRAIADFVGPWTMRQLADVSGASTGATYRVVDYLEREGLAERSEDGKVTVLDWVQILRRWSGDYGFVRTNRITQWIAPRGFPDLTQQIRASNGSVSYAVTGSQAAAEWAAYAPARAALIYVEDAQRAAERWGLRLADAGANVILAEPKFDVVFQRTITNEEGVVIAAPTQVAVDLMTGPGRNPSEAEELISWMQRNEGSWRA